MVIPGWDQGVEGMKVGGRRELIIPPELAYGPEGSPPAIGPNETLIFVIDLLASNIGVEPPLAERLTAQGLAGEPLRSTRARSPSGCWPCRGRTRAGRGWRCARAPRALAAADVDRALSEERSLLITWLNRGTLHLVRSEDYPWLQALTTPPLLTGNARRLRPGGRVAERRPSAASRRSSGRSPTRGR